MRDGDIPGHNVGVFYEWNPEGKSAAEVVVRPDSYTLFQSLESHRRTTYYESLVARGARAVRWTTYEDLLEFLEDFGRS